MSSLLVGRKAPYFSGKAVCKGEIIELSLDRFQGKYVVLFFYPLDFTFVCPTELHAFQDKLQEFVKRGAEVVGCSIDSCYTHQAWMNTPKAKGGIEGIQYPILADLNKKIATDYHVLEEQAGIAFRGLFIIDPKGMVRHQLINDLPIGRSVEEALRTLDAIIFHEQNGEVCPANWHAGEKSMQATPQGILDFFK